MRKCGKILQSGADHKWQYGACALRAGYVRLQTNTHNMSYFIVFPLQQWSHERASKLRYTYFACIVYVCISCRSFPLMNIKVSHNYLFPRLYITKAYNTGFRSNALCSGYLRRHRSTPSICSPIACQLAASVYKQIQRESTFFQHGYFSN